MRVSSMMGWTLREIPALQRREATNLARAGYVREMDGRLILLPLGQRVYRALTAPLMTGENALRLPYYNPGDKEPPRAKALLAASIQSYRQLPARWTLPGGGLSQPTLPPEPWTQPMEQVLIAASSEAELAASLEDEFRRMAVNPALEMLHVHRAAGQAGVELFAVLQEKGLLAGLSCERCGYLGLQAYAAFRREAWADEVRPELQGVSTPGCMTIDDLVQFFDVPAERILKAVMMVQGDEPVMALLAGNLEVSLPKWRLQSGMEDLRPARADEIEALGSTPGFIGPVGLHPSQGGGEGVRIMADYSLQKSAAYITGANKVDAHWTGAVYGRDFQVTEWADLAEAVPGAGCSQCGGELNAVRFSPAAWIERQPGCFAYTAEDGCKEMGTAAVVTWFPLEIMLALQKGEGEPNGAVWPAALAPFQVYLVDLRQPEMAGEIYQRLQEAGVSVLYDDRAVSPGVKFTDEELLGCPLRLTVSKRSLEQGGLELVRKEGAKEIVPLHQLIERARTEVM